MVVFRDKADEGVARLVRSGTGWPRVVVCTIDASDSMWALVEGVLSPSGSAVITWWQRLRMWVQRVVGAYLDGRNGVGKIPPRRCRRHILGGRKVVPNAHILP